MVAHMNIYLTLLYLLTFLTFRVAKGWSVSGLFRVGFRTSLLASSSDQDPEALRAQAEKLREEIAQFEGSKLELQKIIEKTKQKEQEAVKRQRERYSAVVPILKGDGSTQDERVDFPPLYKGGASFITVVEARLPLGMLLGEDKVIIVDEVAKDSNAEKAGIKEGDLIRACTACKMEMEMPTWQVIAGGIGVPKTKRFMYSADGKPLEEVMGAIGSNRQDPEERPVLLVVERIEE